MDRKQLLETHVFADVLVPPLFRKVRSRPWTERVYARPRSHPRVALELLPAGRARVQRTRFVATRVRLNLLPVDGHSDDEIKSCWHDLAKSHLAAELRQERVQFQVRRTEDAEFVG